MKYLIDNLKYCEIKYCKIICYFQKKYFNHISNVAFFQFLLA